MTIKEMIQHAYYDLLSLKVNWFNGIMLALIVLVFRTNISKVLVMKLLKG